MEIKAIVFAGIILIVGTLTSAPLFAQERGWYVGGSVGRSDDDILDEKADGWKLFGGYQFHRNFAVEGSAVDLGDFDFGGVSEALSQDGLAIEIVGILPIGEKGAIFGKAGFFNWEVEELGVRLDDGTDGTAGFGGQIRFGGNWALRAELQRFADVSGGDVDLVSASLIYGFQKSYARAPKEIRPRPEPKPEPVEVTPPPTAPAKRRPAIPDLEAAERGDARAQYNLGYRYSTGKGVPKDEAEGVRWYRKAAEQGHARAQYNLGAAYVNGTGVQADKETGINWFFKAGQSFLREGKRDLALRVVDTIERVTPGHPLARRLLTEIRSRFGQ